MDEPCAIVLPGHACSFIFLFSLRLVISLYLANGHSLSPTKLVLQPHSRVCLQKQLRGRPGGPRFPSQPPLPPTHTPQHSTKSPPTFSGTLPRGVGGPPVPKSHLPGPSSRHRLPLAPQMPCTFLTHTHTHMIYPDKLPLALTVPHLPGRPP